MPKPKTVGCPAKTAKTSAIAAPGKKPAPIATKKPKKVKKASGKRRLH